MYFAHFVMMLVLFGCSLGKSFVLQPSEKEPAAATGSAVLHPDRGRGELLNDIRKTLVRALNLQQEPQVAADRLTAIREQWKTAFSAISHKTQDKAVAVPQAEGPAADNRSGLKCCPLTSQIFLKDLGWENWVIYPESFTYVQCSPCNSQLDLSPSRCPSHTPPAKDAPSQMPCCQTTSTEHVPFLYMDEFSTLTISSVQLTRACGPGNPQPPAED
ncbi:bone morphogenetic protein 7-like [Salvelinus namaycush]|uniref:Bone morphogenetic protein 7-like n=1 Tax=Salvelinus namaycush TaxID=8040 RepID=A0A8U0UAG6_SALNM|nr:bone morphogenetic protein 7-like [Salvelinus namaycush]